MAASSHPQDGLTPLEILRASNPSDDDSRDALMEAAERRAAASASGSPAAAPAARPYWPWEKPSAAPPPEPLSATLLAGLRASGRLTDATLVCEGKEIAVHALVLAAQSSFFESLLLGQFPRRVGRRLQIHSPFACGMAQALVSVSRSLIYVSMIGYFVSLGAGPRIAATRLRRYPLIPCGQWWISPTAAC